MTGAALTTAGLILAVIAVHAGSWWLQRRARRTRQVTITGYLNQPGTRQFTARHHAASDLMWSEFEAARHCLDCHMPKIAGVHSRCANGAPNGDYLRMPGLHQEGRWPQ